MRRNSLSCESEALITSFFDLQATTWADRYESATYKQRRQLVGEIVRREVMRLKRPAKTIRLLDFGCGSGVLLEDAGKFGLQITGVDSSKAMVDAARSRLLGFDGQPKLEWLQNNSGQGSYEGQNYDIVLCLSVLEFVIDYQPLLVRLCDRVAPGGLFVISVPNRYSWLRTLEKFIHHYPGAFRRFPAVDHLTAAGSYLNHQTRQLTRMELRHLLCRQGLTEETHRFHAAPRLLRRIDFTERVGMMLMMTFRK